ncbi:MAG: GNAT family N-acetyltransferase [Gammaproteobacteria bacterium]
MNEVRLAETDSEIAACYPVMAQLRPQVGEESFLPRVRAQMDRGYRLACVRDGEGTVVALAGFRIGLSLSWGTYLYVDDLITDSGRRSQGFGARLLRWLMDYGARQGCGQLHLDSGMQREDAHRFYAREGMARAAYHFSIALEPPQF